MNDDKSAVIFVEKVKVEKFEGDDQTQEPIEIIEIETRYDSQGNELGTVTRTVTNGIN